MKLTIHRGANEIGGSCVEIRSSNNRIVIDIGMPIVTPSGSKTLPDVKGFYKHNNKQRLIDGLLISHAHLDHYGLYNFASADIQYYLGEATHKLINLSNIFIEDRGIINKFEDIQDGKQFHIGDFKITPFLMDHSAYDAYSFLIEGDGKKVFYSGDFRAHGRKWKLFYKFLSTLPEGINALLLEGTSINDRSLNSEYKKEEVVEHEIADILRKHNNTIVFGIASSQNIDRMVTFYKAAKSTGRMFVVDVYTANVLTAIRNTKGKPKIPHPSKDYPEIRVFFPRHLCNKLEKSHRKDMMYKFVPYKITKDEISENLSRVFMLVKSSMSEYLKGIKNLDASPVLYSMWKGYQEDPSMKYFIQGLTKGDESLLYNVHTSGHADVSTLKRLVSQLRPEKVIPIHTFRPEMYKELFNNVVEIADGQEIEI